MKERIKGFIQGFLVCILLVGTVASAQGYTKTIDVLFDSINLTVNGNDVEVDTISYNDTTYAPIREVAEMLGKEVGWDGDTQTASIDDDWISKIEATDVIGMWRSVCFVDNISEFDVNITRDDLMIQRLIFDKNEVTLDLKNGFEKKYSWIDDSINLYNVTSSEFMIKEINGFQYMFLVFKNGDYFNRGMIPSYYVFKKIDDTLDVLGEMNDNNNVDNNEDITESNVNVIEDEGRIFSDLNIEAIVRNQLNKLTGNITKSDLESIKSLKICNIQITSLKGIELLTELEELDMSSTGITDINLLQNLKNLKNLNLFGNNISDINTLSELSNLEYINLRYNYNLKDISALTNLVTLKELYLTNTSVEDISPLVSNVQNGGFKQGRFNNNGYMMLNNNKLNLSDNTTLEHIQYIMNNGVRIDYIPQK